MIKEDIPSCEAVARRLIAKTLSRLEIPQDTIDEYVSSLTNGDIVEIANLVSDSMRLGRIKAQFNIKDFM